jgi:membrane fusion protein (multidrug efflux system)
VQQAQATLLTTVTQLDPIYVDTTWSTTDLMRVRHELERGQLVTVEGKPKVTVVLEDGSEYAQPGTLLFTGVNVDPTTGSVALRALVPNPRGELLPGMYVQARIEEGSQPSALLVPQRAVTRDRTGQATTLLVDRAGKVQLRPLQVDRAVGDAWLVTHGIAAGDQVIVEGLQRARPGATVKPVPARRSPEVR